MTKKLPFNAYIYPLTTIALAATGILFLWQLHIHPEGVLFYEIPQILIPEIALYAGLILCAAFHFARNVKR